MENGDLSRLGWNLGPDAGNLKALSALLGFVQAGLDGVPPDVLDYRDEELRNAVNAAIADGAIPDHFRDRFDGVVAAVESLYADRQFTAAVVAFEQPPDDLPADVRPSLIDAALQAGAPTLELARSICAAVLSAARAR
ncbi:hypothetical protein D3877_16030 [Azospirillum cavernae]|uniref:Uncharacterized protein n=1 Tax=Azospirillum cavernae TaxID=2320860 RepID=A0A418VWS6_9PROT|nr:hypothetical protein [Azospirillum cavernae]RJF81638.1 hypothetical protein D3877_16030 [Azospirillum cavernae]